MDFFAECLKLTDRPRIPNYMPAAGICSNLTNIKKYVIILKKGFFKAHTANPAAKVQNDFLFDSISFIELELTRAELCAKISGSPRVFSGS
jgi:hypothetical protein